MSPEQARGEALDGRTDVFSLGATLYEMVTGERLMAGAKPAEAMELLRGEQEPLKPQARFDRLPSEMERIIRKSLRRNREERYASAGEMLDDLNALKRRLGRRQDDCVVGCCRSQTDHAHRPAHRAGLRRGLFARRQTIGLRRARSFGTALPAASHVVGLAVGLSHRFPVGLDRSFA
jgi:serine/threonine protein kinase